MRAQMRKVLKDLLCLPRFPKPSKHPGRPEKGHKQTANYGFGTRYDANYALLYSTTIK